MTVEAFALALKQGFAHMEADAEKAVAEETLSGNQVKLAQAQGEHVGLRMARDLVDMLLHVATQPAKPNPMFKPQCAALFEPAGKRGGEPPADLRAAKVVGRFEMKRSGSKIEPDLFCRENIYTKADSSCSEGTAASLAILPNVRYCSFACSSGVSAMQAMKNIPSLTDLASMTHPNSPRIFNILATPLTWHPTISPLLIER